MCHPMARGLNQGLNDAAAQGDEAPVPAAGQHQHLCYSAGPRHLPGFTPFWPNQPRSPKAFSWPLPWPGCQGSWLLLAPTCHPVFQ